MNNKPEDFIVYHHTVPVKESGKCFTSITVLSELIGVPWNDITMCYALALTPTSIRVSDGSITADSSTGRITILINNKKDKIIKSVSMEVAMPSPELCGYDMDCLLKDMKSKRNFAY